MTIVKSHSLKVTYINMNSNFGNLLIRVVKKVTLFGGFIKYLLYTDVKNCLLQMLRIVRDKY